MSLLPVETALASLLGKAHPIMDREEVVLHEADGRVLAEDVAARLTQPPFDASAMDGYGARAADVTAPGALLKVIGESAAGHGFDGAIGPGEAVRIFTGAPVPQGVDTVILQEDTLRRDDGMIEVQLAGGPGRHIRPRGQDFAEGEIVLRAGVAMDFTRLTVAAAMNHARLTVYRRPTIAVLATGDELVSPGDTPGPNQIIASNSYGIAAFARRAGAEVVDLGIVADRHDALAEAIARARQAKVDVLVTLGGASVGDYDLVQDALKSAGMMLDFWKIAMRPGKPLMVGALGDMHILGLPGNPASSLVCAILFLEPLLARLGHRPLPERQRIALSGSDLKANDKRQDYMRARLERDASGQWIATAFEHQDSSLMKVFSQSEALIVRPPNAPALAKGEPCPILQLRDPEA